MVARAVVFTLLMGLVTGFVEANHDIIITTVDEAIWDAGRPAASF